MVTPKYLLIWSSGYYPTIGTQCYRIDKHVVSSNPREGSSKETSYLLLYFILAIELYKEDYILFRQNLSIKDPIKNLAYVDDTIIFTNVEEKPLKRMIKILKKYEDVSGQLISLRCFL